MSFTRLYCPMSLLQNDGKLRRCNGPVNILTSDSMGETYECIFCKTALRLVYVAPSYYVTYHNKIKGTVTNTKIPVGGPKVLKPIGM